MAGVKRILFGVVAVAACTALALCDRRAWTVWLLDRVAVAESLGMAGIGYYFIGFAISTLLFIPTVSMEMVAGLIFVRSYGICAAIAIALLSKLNAMSLHFLLGKSLLRRMVVDKVLPRFPIFGAVAKVADKEPFKATVVMRFTPTPTVAKNLGLAVLNVPFVTFLIVTTFFALPWTAIAVFAGSTLTSLPEIFDGKGQEKLAELMRPWKQNPLVLGSMAVLGTCAVAATLVWAKRAYKEAINEDGDMAGKTASAKMRMKVDKVA